MLQKYPIFAFLHIMPDLLVDGHIYIDDPLHDSTLDLKAGLEVNRKRGMKVGLGKGEEGRKGRVVWTCEDGSYGWLERKDEIK